MIIFILVGLTVGLILLKGPLWLGGWCLGWMRPRHIPNTSLGARAVGRRDSHRPFARFDRRDGWWWRLDGLGLPNPKSCNPSVGGDHRLLPRIPS